ncbi:MAG: sensor histidine kinase [Lachnospiraceae bacterium]|nr:sensor histidine kinase [Lachnospiraceae bacterium]
MKILSFFSNKSIKVKILCSMLILAVCMILAYMLVSISYSYKSIRDSFIQSSLQDLSSAQNNADNLLSIVENYSVILATDDTIQNTLTYSNKPEGSYLSVNEILLRNQINNIIGTFPRINAVLICDVWGNIYDSGVTVISPNDAWQELTSASGWQNTAPAPYYISVIGGSVRPDVISYTCTVCNWRSGALLGYLTIFVDETFVQDLYAPAEDENCNMFLLSYGDTVISAKDSALLYAGGPVGINELSGNADFISTSDNYYIYKKYPALQCYFVKEISKQTIQSTIHYMELFMITIGAALIVVTVFMSILIARHLTRDIFKLYNAAEQIKNGNWDVQIACSSRDEIGLLARKFNAMIEEIRYTTRRLMDEQQLKREYQLELLNQQINPHFLYNTLDNICSLAELGYANELTELVNNLSSFYRGVLSKGSHIISLRRELEIAVSYLRIMQTRYYNTFSFQIDVPKELMENNILRLTLQPILENAICHGFESHQPGGVITISSKIIHDTVCLYVEDNGIGMTQEQVHNLLKETEKPETRDGFALKNVHNRLELYYGPDYGLKVESRQGMGTKVTITLPHKPCPVHTPA